MNAVSLSVFLFESSINYTAYAVHFLVKQIFLWPLKFPLSDPTIDLQISKYATSHILPLVGM